MQTVNPRASSGFTLLEVVIAMAVLSIAVVALVQALGNNVRNSSHLNDKMLANWLAQNQLNNILLKPNPKLEDQSGELEFAARKWRYSLKVNRVEQFNIDNIELKIYRAGTKNSLVTLRTGISAQPLVRK